MKLTQKLKLLFTIPLFFIFLNCSVGQSLKSCDAPHTLNIIPPVESFVKVLMYDDDGDVRSTGSGIIIEQLEESTIILTAKHLCVKDMSRGTEFVDVGLLDFHEKLFESVVVKVDDENDLCLIATMIRKIKSKPVVLANSKPIIGMHVYNLAAPLGIFNSEMVLIFEGFYSGDRTKENTTHSVYTFPGMGGSSGSAVLDENFKLIGVVSLGVVRFKNLMIAVDYNSISQFLESSKELTPIIELKIKEKNIKTIDMLLRIIELNLSLKSIETAPIDTFPISSKIKD